MSGVGNDPEQRVISSPTNKFAGSERAVELVVSLHSMFAPGALLFQIVRSRQWTIATHYGTIA